jgi:hypothetical protein
VNPWVRAGFGVLLLLAAGSACAQPSGDPSASSPGNGGTSSDAGTGGGPPDTPIRVVRYVFVDATKWPRTPQSQVADLYSRLEVVQPDVDPNVWPERAYDLERRTLLERVLVNHTLTVTTLAKAQIRDPDLDTSLPLFSIEHDSIRGSGESFITTFTASHVQTPLFRIGPNTTLTVHLTTQVTDEQKTNGIADLIQAVQTVVSLAAPTSSVLTALSKPEVSKAATAVDEVIGGLLSRDLSEDIELGRRLETWTWGAELTVLGKVPRRLIKADRGDDSPINPSGDLQIGTWKVRITCPKPSLFSEQDLCDLKKGFEIYKRHDVEKHIWDTATSSQVLQTYLSSQVTVQAFIQTQSWYTSYLQIKSPLKDTDVQAMCSNAIISLYAVGLNQFDAKLVVKEMGEQMPGIVRKKDDALSVAVACRDLLALPAA